jgi:hypothetical protein
MVLSKEGRRMARKLWIQRSTRGILDVKRTAPLEGWSDHRGHGWAIWMPLGNGVMKDVADNSENDRGVLVDLYIPRHCSATSQSLHSSTILT